MLLAVLLVVGLAYLDLRREQARALADFMDEQSLLAHTLAASLDPSSPLLRGELPHYNDAEALQRIVVFELSGRAVDLTPNRDGWRPLSNDAEIRGLVDAARAQNSPALLLSRPAAESLGLGRRMAVAAFAPLRGGGSLAVITSARRVRDRARVGTWRLVAATGLASLLVALFGVFLFRQERQALLLGAQLKLQRAEKLATIGTLAAGVAHEVGTPLGVISGRAEQLLSRAGGDETLVKGLTSILTQVGKLSSTIRQLLDFARTRPIEATAVAPIAALETARALLEHRFRRAKVLLTIDVPPGVPAVNADPGQLEQVLVNLLMNAADACAAGGQVRATVTGGEPVEIAISDDGCGILPQHLSLVLDPFFTTKERGQGTGLGLSIAADIIKHHGGTLHLESTVGRGTTVRVRLPAARSA
jgi:signal transduction histidine kinase